MAHQHHKGRYHPSRISGMQKQMRAREVNKLKGEKKNKPLDQIDLNKQNWSVNNSKNNLKG